MNFGGIEFQKHLQPRQRSRPHERAKGFTVLLRYGFNHFRQFRRQVDELSDGVSLLLLFQVLPPCLVCRRKLPSADGSIQAETAPAVQV